jgi:hypothetical protein
MAGPPPIPAHELTEDSPEMVNPETFLADDLARRAFRAAVFSVMTMGIIFLSLGLGAIVSLGFCAYSCWLLLRLCRMPGELSPRSSNRLLWAFCLNVLVLLTWVLVVQHWFW